MQISNELSLNKKADKHVCMICPLAKQKRSPFVCRNNVASKSFDHIHCDIWGPYHVNSYQEHRYFVTIVDYDNIVI